MPTTPLDRLLFVQGGKCFFCQAPLPRADASVEHLVASSKGGSNDNANCVACCKAVNALFGSMSLKEKFSVVLNQRGRFVCPNGSAYQIKAAPAIAAQSSAAGDGARLELVIQNLAARENAKPRTVKTLRNSIAALFPGISTAEVEALIADLQASGKVVVNDTKISYAL